jgi:hypothetical protein
MPSDLIYAIRQALEKSQGRVSPEAQARLRQFRARALLAAEKTYSRSAPPQPARRGLVTGAFFRSPIWGAGVAFASLTAVVIAISAVHDRSIDLDISQIAEIDKRMISDRLPVQAYLDPGFLAFQEESLEEASDLIRVASSISLPTPGSASPTPLRAILSADNLFPGIAGNNQGMHWGKLTTTQREALAPLEAMWGDLDESRRRKWVKIADRFHQLSEEQQKLAQERMQEWVALGPVERRQARAIYGGVANRVPEDIRVVKWNEYQKLSPDERNRLMELAQQRIAEADSSKSAALRNEAHPGTLAPAPRSALATRADKPLASH